LLQPIYIISMALSRECAWQGALKLVPASTVGFFPLYRTCGRVFAVRHGCSQRVKC
jgi:hypothetical protein